METNGMDRARKHFFTLILVNVRLCGVWFGNLQAYGILKLIFKLLKKKKIKFF